MVYISTTPQITGKYAEIRTVGSEEIGPSETVVAKILNLFHEFVSGFSSSGRLSLQRLLVVLLDIFQRLSVGISPPTAQRGLDTFAAARWLKHGGSAEAQTMLVRSTSQCSSAPSKGLPGSLKSPARCVH